MAEHSLTDWQLQCEGPGGQGLRREYKPSITWQALEFSSVWIVCHLKICKVSIRLCQYVRISPKHILTRSWMFEKFVSMVLTLVWTSWLRKVFSNLTDFGCLSLIALKLDEAGFGLEVSVYKNSNWITFKGKLIKQASAFPSQTNKRGCFLGVCLELLLHLPFSIYGRLFIVHPFWGHASFMWQDRNKILPLLLCTKRIFAKNHCVQQIHHFRVFRYDL